MANNILITNGPSREELFDNLRLFAEKRLTPFLVKKNKEEKKEKYVAVVINSIKAEDENGQLWGLTLSINKKFISSSFFSDKPKKPETGVASADVSFEGFRNLVRENYLVEEFRKDTVIIGGHYSTKTRQGIIFIS